MLNKHSIETVDLAVKANHFLWPLYDSYCFSRIPGSIVFALLGESPYPTLPRDSIVESQPKFVLSLFIDSFGWIFFERFADDFPLLRRFVQDGIVTKLTSQFPSTTAAHVTTFNTGMTVGEHGVCEWYYYDPIVGEIINPLRFSLALDIDRNTLVDRGFPGSSILPINTIHSSLRAHGLKSASLVPAEYLPSEYNATVNQGAETIGYRGISEGCEIALQQLTNGTNHTSLYHGNIDTVAHIYSPFSAEHIREARFVFDALEKLVAEVLRSVPDTLILLFADHGQVSVKLEDHIYIDRELPELAPLLRKTASGGVRAPGGSSRGFFCYVGEENREEVKEMLERQLQGAAAVYRAQDLISQGVFGTTVTSRFIERFGDLIVVPFKGVGVWWSGDGKFDLKQTGKHGGASSEEMTIALMSLSNC